MGHRIACRIVLAALAFAPPALAQVDYVDAYGREWRRLTDTTGRTWDQIDALCPNDGATPCSGSLGGADLGGWVWATQQQVKELLAQFAPEIAQLPAVGGPGYVLPGLFFFGEFLPTFEFYTTFGGYNYLNGWTSTLAGGLAIAPEVSAEWPVFYGSFDTGAAVATNAVSQYRGAWLFKPAPGPFQTLGSGLPGATGYSVLTGSGTLAAGAPTSLGIANGAANAPALLAIGASAANLPLLGGTFVPSPDLLLTGLSLDATGALALSAPWPAGVPAAVSLYFQAWFPDAGAPAGVAATNALKLTTP